MGGTQSTDSSLRRAEVAVDTRDLAAVADALPDAVLLVDAAAQVIWANQAAERFFGVELEAAIGMSGLDLIHPDDFQIALLALTSVQGKEVGSPLELRLRAHDGWRLVELIGAPLGDRLVMSVRDLTERRRWEVAHGEDARFRAMIHNAAMITMLIDADGVVEGSSGALSRILGHDQEWLEGRPLTDMLDRDDHGRWLATLAEIAAPGTRSGAVLSVDLQCLSRDGSTLPLAVQVKNLLDDPTVNALVVSAHDVSDRVAAEEALRSANSVLGATLESTADGILVIDTDWRITSCNRRFVEMWRVDPEAVATGDSGVVMRSVRDQLCDPDGFEARVLDLVADPEAISHDVIEFLDGRVFERDSMPQRIDGKVVGRVWSFRDTTEHRVLRDELTHRAFHDPLTELANQLLFRRRVEQAVARLDHTGGHLAVLFLDLDDFKTVNDSLGHPVGDELLVAVSARLRACVRPSDTVARLGGDEFAVLIEDLTDEREAISVAERMVGSLREPVVLASSRRVVASASVGIAFATGGDRVDTSDLLRNADLAMYNAKARGKSCYRVYAPAMYDAALERLEVEAHLRGAADRGELVVVYQPIFDRRTGRVTAMESLVRWQHPERGLLGPASFIPFAEESGLIDEIGTHVLERSLAQVVRWESAVGAEAPAVNVNLAPRQLLDRWLPERVAGHLARCGLDPSRLILEITEGALMADPRAAAQNLHRLRRMGVRLAVDDFGTGYSSLAYLQRFPIDFLKIDGSFVNEILTGRGSSMVQVIVQLSHTLGLVPIAEGVESEAQAVVLDRFGCDLAQGYHLARPLDAEAALALVIENHADRAAGRDDTGATGRDGTTGDTTDAVV